MMLTIGDIIYLNDIGKLLKQKNFMWLDNKIFGLDNPNYICLLYLNPEKLSVLPQNGLIFNQRELSKFTKSISIENSFEISDVLNVSLIATMSETLTITKSPQVENRIIGTIRTVNEIESQIINLPEVDMTQRLEELYSMNRSSGALQYKYDRNHILTLFSGVLPLAKADKLLMKLWDNSNTTFLVRFRIPKKQANIFVYLLYLKI